VRRTILSSLLAFAAVAVLAGSASGERQGLVNLANGRYGFTGTAAGSTFDIWPMTFQVRGRSDGSATGRYSYRQVRDGVELTVSGPLTCATIRGSQAWVGGTIEESSRANLVGLDMWFQVQDNDHFLRGSGGPEMSSTVGAGGPGTARAYCDAAPRVMFPFFLDRGSLFVSG
jgi:hypothetical protein